MELNGWKVTKTVEGDKEFVEIEAQANFGTGIHEVLLHEHEAIDLATAIIVETGASVYDIQAEIDSRVGEPEEVLARHPWIYGLQGRDVFYPPYPPEARMDVRSNRGEQYRRCDRCEEWSCCRVRAAVLKRMTDDEVVAHYMHLGYLEETVRNNMGFFRTGHRQHVTAGHRE